VCAQKYQPLVEEGKYWIYQFLDQPDGGACIFNWTEKAEIHHFGEDTLLENIEYKKILNSSLKLTGVMGSVKMPFEIDRTKVMGYIREDTSAKKVYVLPNELMYDLCSEVLKEYLLFDFSLERGDSINECLAYYIYQLRDQFEYPEIDSTRYELDFYGKSRKHFYSFGYFDQCNFWHVPGYIMEGFGFIDGPFRGDINRELITYCEGTLADCNIISSTKDEAKDAIDIKIYPNPATEFISFYLDQHSTQKVNQYCIRDMSGQLIKGIRPITSDINYVIHTHDFPSGIYIIQFLNNGQIVQSEKFIISH